VSPTESRALEPVLPARTARALPRTFEALADRNFRWFFGSLFGHFTAMNMQMFVRGWVVFELTGDFAALGLISLVTGLAGLATSLVGGVLADRARRKVRVVQACQAVSALTALAVGLLISAGALRFAHLLVASAIQGAVMNVMMPSRQALTPDVVGMQRLMNAIALNTSGMNVARLLMPGLAGGMVSALGGGDGDIAPAQYVYFMMTGLYLWSILGLFQVRVTDREQPAERPPALRELWDGFVYVGRDPTMRMLIGLNFFMVLFSMTYFQLLPGFAKEVLGVGPGRLGLLTSVSGVGSLVGSLLVASLPSRRRGLMLLGSGLLLGVALVGFAASTVFWLSLAILTVVGVGQAGRMSLSNVLIQAYVRDEYRGRVMSIYMLEISLMSLGIYVIGLLADAFGAPLAIGGSAVGMIVMVVGILALVPRYRNLD
jgi:MFS family permease